MGAGEHSSPFFFDNGWLSVEWGLCSSGAHCLLGDKFRATWLASPSLIVMTAKGKVGMLSPNITQESKSMRVDATP